MITLSAQEATVCLTQISPSASSPSFHPQTTMHYPLLFDYRLLTVISAQFNFTIWQFVLSVPFSPKWTLHLLRRQFTCLHLVRAICKAKAKHQNSEKGGSFNAQISFHLRYRSASLIRAEWEFRKEIFKWALNLKHSDSKARPSTCNSLRHQNVLTYLHPLWHTLEHTWQRYTYTHTKMDRHHSTIRCHIILKIKTMFPF